MRNDGDRACLQFPIDRIGRLEEKQIAVEIGNPFSRWLALQHKKHPGRRTCEVIFEQAAGWPGSGNLGISRFEFSKPSWNQVRQIETCKRPVALVSQAQHPQAGAGCMPL